MNVNKVIIAGNLTRDPELRHTPNNTAVANFGIAVNERWKSGTGEQKERTTFIDCEAWGKTGEAIARFCSKGRPLFIEGALQLDQWDDRDGNKRTKLKVRVNGFEFVGPKPEARGMEAASEPGPAPMDASEIPF